MLDDVFSGLDATSEDRIFSRLLGSQGLLRRLGTTIILVTHAAHRLSYADHIIALSARGTVVEQGKLGQLLKSDGYVAGITTRHTAEVEQVLEQKTSAAKDAVVPDVDRQNAAADLSRPVGNWSVYNYYIQSIGRGDVAAWTLVMIIYSVLVEFPSKCHCSNHLSNSADLNSSLDQILDWCCCHPWQFGQWHLLRNSDCPGNWCPSFTYGVVRYALYQDDTAFRNVST